MSKAEAIACPAYLDGALRARWEELAPRLQAMGTLDAGSVDIAAKFLLAENEYLRVSSLVQSALQRGDPEDSNKWLAAQERLTKQILMLGEELGLTPKARRARGIGWGK